MSAIPAGKKLGGMDFGYRNPFAAIWGVLDRDDVLWLTGEHYCRQKPLSYHAKHLPRDVYWYADPSAPATSASCAVPVLSCEKATTTCAPASPPSAPASPTAA